MLVVIKLHKKLQILNLLKKLEKKIKKNLKKMMKKLLKIRKKEEAFSKVEKQIIGNFSPNNNNAVPQSNIKKKLAELLKVQESELTDLNVDYENNTGTVKIKDSSKAIEFKFSVKEKKINN
ncbi:Hypothetical protein MSC_1034 [Mycoplasma mycoides subsp. mycoides SC str. PG1]|uniref:Uncharacterized protein n=3 Tax=Mycoplasma mycoides TaxID=2102 RepID=Q6MRV2_MYCMS|nr:Hypothetical protein MSC_1034 [Mycoplasma mycoides subsp. mycoides SC str. PG1]